MKPAADDEGDALGETHAGDNTGVRSLEARSHRFGSGKGNGIGCRPVIDPRAPGEEGSVAHERQETVCSQALPQCGLVLDDVSPRLPVAQRTALESALTGRGESFRMDDRTEMLVSPSKGRQPVAISYRRIPSEKTSERASTALPSACSGDMYAKVPTILPSWVTEAVGSWVGVSSPVAAGSASLARPKSSTLGRPSGVTMTLAGFRSR